MYSSLQYIGEVSITINKQTTRYKNSGTPLLFEYFCRWLAGYELSSDVIPAYIQILEDNTPITYSNIQVSPSIKSTTHGWITTFNATILNSNLNVDNINTDSIYYLHLQNSSGETLAIVQLDSEKLSQISTGRQALVQWSLRLANKGDVDINE